ncbi:MAG: S8 family serine peptidase [Steroidobacteraceae bacterium]
MKLGPLLLSGLLVLAATTGTAEEFNPVRREPAARAQTGTARVIIRLRSATAARKVVASRTAPAGMATIASRQRATLHRQRAIGAGMEAAQFIIANDDTPQALIARLRDDPDVEFAEEDRRRYPQALPNDPLFNGQWYLQAAQPAAIDAVGAWDTTTGSKGVVIADIDTGVRFDHPDLKRAADGGRLLPGYDFITADNDGSFRSANDSDGRDSDPSDPGDWITATDKNTTLFADCDVTDSSWHGTRVAGILGALSNNSTGIAGTTWSAWILPVRVMGKCGGYDSDIIAGMRWAAGLAVDGVPTNAYPARILNLSLGSSGVCPESYQTVIDELAARGVVVVASAGNEGGQVSVPGNCDGAIAVTGLRHVGTKVGFANLGPEVTVGAPGGNCVNVNAGEPCLFSIDTTLNAGTTGPGANDYSTQLDYNVGTSFSSPIVAGIAGLMVAVNGNLRTTQIIARLREGAQPYPAATDPNIPVCHVPANAADLQDFECHCTATTCGAGMANARRSVAAAQRPIAAIQLPSSVAAGQNVTLRASGSAAACNRTLSSYAWSVVGGGASPPAISGAGTDTATVAAPASGTLTLQLTVTDNTGATDSALVVLTSSSASSAAPANAGSAACPAAISVTPPTTPITNSGGGGSTGAAGVFALALLGLYRRRQRS